MLQMRALHLLLCALYAGLLVGCHDPSEPRRTVSVPAQTSAVDEKSRRSITVPAPGGASSQGVADQAHRDPNPPSSRAIAPSRSGEASESPVAVASRPAHREVKPSSSALANDPVARLAQQLTEGLSADRDKALALYRWVASEIAYDTDSFFAGRFPPADPESVLKSRLAVCDGYSQLYRALGQAVGLKVEQVTGDAKGFERSAGSASGLEGHAWNAVMLEGRWRLVDPTWGSGHIDETQRFARRATDDYFDVAPEQMIYTHFPKEERWQLLSRPLSRAQFHKFPKVWPTYFEYGLEPDRNLGHQVRAGSALSFEVTTAQDAKLGASVEKDGKKLEDNHALVLKQGRSFQIHATFPSSGQYSLTLFAGAPSDSSTRSAVRYLVQSSGGGAPLPKSFAALQEEQVVKVEPMTPLPLGRPVQVKVVAPGARSVFAQVDGERVPLEATGDRFQGSVTPAGEEIPIFADYSGNGQYRGLFAYRVKR